MIPTGWYSLTQSLMILLGVALAATGRDKRMLWPAGAMLLSLLSARLATAQGAYVLPVLLLATPACLLIAMQGRNTASRVIAVTYVPRVACYSAYALGVLPLWAMWEFSNAFLWIQIGALYAGSLGGGHRVRDWLAVGGGLGRRDGAALPGAAATGVRAEPDTGGPVAMRQVGGAPVDADGW